MKPSIQLLREQYQIYEGLEQSNKAPQLRILYNTYKAGRKVKLWFGPCYCSPGSRWRVIEEIQRIIA